MFSSTYDRAVGRIAFGVTALAGLLVFVWRLLYEPRADAAKTLLAVWAVALFASQLAAQLSRAFARRRDLARVFSASWVLPALGMALLLPLTIHLPFAVAIGGGLRGFDDWARMSLVIAGPAHVVFAIMVARRASQLARGLPAVTPRRIYIGTLIAASLPWAILFLLPPLIVGITGFPLLAGVERMATMIDRERERVDLPHAIVVA